MSDRKATLTFSDTGKSIDLDILSGTDGPDTIDITRLYGQGKVFTFDPGFVATASLPFPAADRFEYWLLDPTDGSPLALAGLWEHWQDADGNELASCTILVGEANAQVKAVHERMPVVIDPTAFDLWLDIHSQKPQPLETLLAAQRAPALTVYPVGLAVNNPKVDQPELIAALEGDA